MAPLGLVAASGPLLALAGFTAGGITAGSLGASLMSMYGGNVAAGSLVAILQSWGAAGLGAGAVGTAGGMVAVCLAIFFPKLYEKYGSGSGFVCFFDDDYTGTGGDPPRFGSSRKSSIKMSERYKEGKKVSRNEFFKSDLKDECDVPPGITDDDPCSEPSGASSSQGTDREPAKEDIGLREEGATASPSGKGTNTKEQNERQTPQEQGATASPLGKGTNTKERNEHQTPLEQGATAAPYGKGTDTEQINARLEPREQGDTAGLYSQSTNEERPYARSAPPEEGATAAPPDDFDSAYRSHDAGDVAKASDMDDHVSSSPKEMIKKQHDSTVQPERSSDVLPIDDSDITTLLRDADLSAPPQDTDVARITDECVAALPDDAAQIDWGDVVVPPLGGNTEDAESQELEGNVAVAEASLPKSGLDLL